MELDLDYERYYGEFLDDKSVCDEFGIPDLNGYTVLFAIYTNEAWEGEAWLLLEKNGELYISEASHCSCYGLDGAFDPVLTSPETIRWERWTALDPQKKHRELIDAILLDFEGHHGSGN